MMSSDQYSKLHRTLTQMPPQLSPQHPPQEEPNNIMPSSSRGSPHRSSMPPLSLDEETRRQSRQWKGPLAASLNAPSAQTAVDRAEHDNSFTRDFFGSKHRTANKLTKRNTWFSKRNMKIDEDENDSYDDNDSHNSLRDPLNLRSSVVRRQQPPPHPVQHNSDRTFDYDYGSTARGATVEQMQTRQNLQKQRGQEEKQQSIQQEQPRQLKTLQEHVIRRHQESADSPDSPSRHYEPTVARAAAAAVASPPPTRQQSDDAESSWMERHAMEEAMAEMQQNRQKEQRYKSSPLRDHRYEEPDDRQIYRDQRQRSRGIIQSQRYELQHQNRPQLQQQNQQYSKREYIQNLRSEMQPSHRQNQLTENEYEDTSLIHDIIRSTDARGRDGMLLSRNQVLTELGIRLDEQEYTSRMREQRHNVQRHQQPWPRDQGYGVAGVRGPQSQRNPQQNLSSQQESRASTLPDDQTWIQDVLHSAKKGNVSADVLESLIESVAEEQTQQQPNHRDSVDSWMVDALKSAKKGNYSADVLETLMESVACPDEESSSVHNSPLEGEQRNSSDSWIMDALKSAKRDGYSADALRTLVESVGVSDRNAEEKPKLPSEKEVRTRFRDRNSVDSWMADARQESSANPDVLEELLGAQGEKTGHQSSDTRQYSNNISGTVQHHSIVYRDSRGPVPTDDMLNDSLISLHSSSNGSRVVGDNVMVVQRKKPENDASCGGKETEDSKSSGTHHEDNTIAHDLIDQLGPDVDIETIPDDVLKAFGLTRNQLRRAESADEQARGHAAKIRVFKSSEDSRTSTSKEISASNKPEYPRKLSPDDEVSWVEESPFADRAYVNNEKGESSYQRNISETSSRRGSLSSSLKEIATDNRGPIPEADMLEEAFSGGSTNRESMAGSLTNLIHVIENKSTSNNGDSNFVVDELKPSTGFTRHCLHRRSTPLAQGGSTNDDVDAVAMKKRLEIIAIIEQERERTT